MFIQKFINIVNSQLTIHYKSFSYHIPIITLQMSQTSPSQQQDFHKSLQTLLQKLTIRPHYQYLFIGFMCLIWLQITYSAMLGAYVFMNPIFQCSDGQARTELEACEQSGVCKVGNTFTASYYCGMFCEGKGVRSVVQSVYALGALIGMFGMPALSDARGRRFTVVSGFWVYIIGLAILILGIYQNITVLMLIGHLLIGIFTSGIVVLSYVLTGQLCSDSMRQTAIMFYCAVWGLGEISFFFLYEWMPEWYNYVVLLLFVPGIGLALVSGFFVIDTPEYCVVMAKDYGKFCKAVEEIGLYNSVPREQIEEVKNIGHTLIQQLKQGQSNKQAATFKQTMKALIKNKKSLVTCLCLALCQLSYNIFYYGVQGSLERTGFNFGISMLIIGVHEFLAYMTASYFIKKIKRKKGLIISIIITSLLGLTFLLELIKQNLVLQSIIISLTRISCVYAYSLLSILETESFPVQIKSTAIGLTVGLSQLGRIGVPYLITGMNDMGVHPVIVAAVVFLGVGIGALMPVKETWRDVGKERMEGDRSEVLIQKNK